jgi:hypothetical protein
MDVDVDLDAWRQLDDDVDVPAGLQLRVELGLELVVAERHPGGDRRAFFRRH